MRAKARSKSSIVNHKSELGWCGCRESHPVGGGAQALSLARRHSAVKPQPRKLRGPGAFSHFRPFAISKKNKHLLAIYSIPTRGFTAVVSVFGGTPPAKPLNCKIRFAVSGQAISRAWAHHAGDDSKFVLAKFNLSPEDITRMSCYSCSQIANLSLTAIHTVSSAGE